MHEISRGIIINPEIKGGRPVLKGTRVPLSLVPAIGLSGRWSTQDEIIQEYDAE